MGKLKEKFYLEAAAEYAKRLGGYCRLQMVELPEERLPAGPSDAQIRAALKQRQKGMTTLIISHRITTLSQADSILVLEDGRVVDQGTHAELCARPGLYQRINNIQNVLEEELSRDALQTTSEVSN